MNNMTRSIKYLFFFLFLWTFAKARSDEPSEHEDGYLRFGEESWTCKKLHNKTHLEITNVPNHFKHFLKWNGKIVVMLDDWLRMAKINEHHSFILIVPQTNSNQTSMCQCLHKNEAVQENSQYYKVTLADTSDMELHAGVERKMELITNVSFVGIGKQSPVFQCTFNLKERRKHGNTCFDDLYKMNTCNFEIVNNTEDDPPITCRLTNESIWRNEKLTIVQSSVTNYVNEGQAYSVCCHSTSEMSVSWYFKSVLEPTEENLLYNSWTLESVNQSLSDKRYYFNHSDDGKTHNMKISHVTGKHAGTYKCIYNSTGYLIENKIELVVIEQSSIKYLVSSNQDIMIMSVSYVSHTASEPLLHCISNNDVINPTSKICNTSDEVYNKCNAIYVGIDNVPDKCQILFDNYMLRETSKHELRGNIEHVKDFISNTTDVIVISVGVLYLIITFFIAYYFYKGKKVSDNYKTKDDAVQIYGKTGARTIGIKSNKQVVKAVKRNEIMKLIHELGINNISIENVEEYEDDGGSCTITFSTHDDASAFFNRFSSICESLSFELNWHETWPVRNGCRGMKMKIRGDEMDETDIRLCLEDEKYGGVKNSVEEIIFKDEEIAVVMFNDASDLLNILSKNSVIDVQSTILNLKMIKPLLPPLYYPDDVVDRKKLPFCNISLESYGDEAILKSFIECISQSEIDYFIFYRNNSDKVCISLKTIPDYSKILMETCTRPFNGHMIKVQLMRQTFQIQVRTSCPMTTDDIKSYFSNNKNSRKSFDLKVEVKNELETLFILTYDDYEDIDNVSRQQHEINGTKCCATPYYGDVYDNCEWKEDLPPDYDPTKSFLSQPYNINFFDKGSRTVGIQRLKGGRVKKNDVTSFVKRSKFNSSTIEYIEEYDDYGGVCTVTFLTCKDAFIFRNKFINFYKTIIYTDWHETWPVRNGCRALEIKIQEDEEMEEDDIKTCLEDKKYGGEKDSIEEVVFKDEEVVVVVFEDVSVLQKLSIKIPEIESQNSSLQLKLMKPLIPPLFVANDEVDKKTLIFYNIHPECYGVETKLRLFVESITQSEIDYFIFNSEYSDDVCVSMKTIPNYSSIMMLTCTRPFNGLMIRVERMNQTSVIQVATSNPMSKNDVMTYFSDNQKSGGGPILKIQFKNKLNKPDELSTHFLLTFEKSENVHNVSRRLHKIDGVKCCATPYYGEWQDNLSPYFDPTKSSLSQSYKSSRISKGSKTIGIKCKSSKRLKSVDVTSFVRRLKFKNSTIEYIEEYDCDSLCTVTFSSRKDASIFRNKLISFYKTLFELDWLETWPVQNGCRGLEIKIYDGGMEESYIRSCLEDEKYGGGKDFIEEVIFKDEETVVVVFKDTSDLQNMLSKNCTTLHLKIMKPLIPPLYIPNDEVDKKKLIFFNIHPKCYGDEMKLRSFIENISQSDVDYFIFCNYDIDDVCVSMKTIPNYSKIMMETCTRPYQGHMIKVQMMRQTYQIQARTSHQMSKDDVKSYFSDNKRSGGGPVSEISFKNKNDRLDTHATHFILNFKQNESVDNVSRRLHEIDGVKCCVTPYYGEVDSFFGWKVDLISDFDPTKLPSTHYLCYNA